MFMRINLYIFIIMIISSKRLKQEKRGKDFDSVRNLLSYVSKEYMRTMFNGLGKKQQKTIEDNDNNYLLELWQ